MANPLVFEVLMVLSMVMVMDIVKHWTLLIIGDVFAFDYQVKEASIVFYIILSYTAYFYGKSVGGWAWHELEKKLGEKSTAVASIMAMALCNFLLGLSGGVNTFIVIKFLTGACTNVSKIGARFLIENVPKNQLKLVFMLKSGTNLIGTISSPFFGYLIQKMTHRFSMTCAIIAGVCLIVSIIGIFFTFRDPDPSNMGPEDEDEYNNLLHATLFISKEVQQPEKSLWQHYMVENVNSRSLIILLLVNGCMMEADFVLTSLFFTGIYRKGDFLLKEDAVGYANLFSSLLGAVLVILVDRTVPSKLPYKTFLASMVVKTALFALLTPFTKYIVRSSDHRVFYLSLFYILKYSISFHLYEGLIVYFINRYVLLEHREKLLRAAKVVLEIINGTVFGLLIWLLNFVSSNHPLSRIQPFNYTAPFWIIAAVQLATVHLSLRVVFPKPGSAMSKRI